MAECLYCIHSRCNILTGVHMCESEEAKRELGEETVKRFAEGGEHDCPFFEDDMLPW